MSEYKPQAGDRVEITLTAPARTTAHARARLEDVEVLHAAPASQE